jgi:hypothetical protein
VGPVLVDSSSYGRNGAYHGDGNAGGTPVVGPYISQQELGATHDPDNLGVAFVNPPGGVPVPIASAPPGTFNINGQWSIEFWGRSPRLTTQVAVVQRDNGCILLGPVWGEGTQCYATFTDIDGNQILQIPMPDTGWHHIVFTYDPAGPTLSAYIDGSPALAALPAQQITYSVSPENGPTALIGPLGPTPTYVVADELAVYNQILLPDQILTHYAAGIGDGVGSALANTGFSLPLERGWNEIDLYVYQPARADIANWYAGNGLASTIEGGTTVAVLFQPDIFQFSPASGDSWFTSPLQPEYPVWADGAPMRRLSEFGLRFNTHVWDSGSWAWHLDPVSGTADYALLNYNPAPTPSNNPGQAGSATLDTVWAGNPPLFRLTYDTATVPTNTFVYQAQFTRNQNADSSPVLRSYRFIQP